MGVCGDVWGCVGVWECGSVEREGEGGRGLRFQSIPEGPILSYLCFSWLSGTKDRFAAIRVLPANGYVGWCSTNPGNLKPFGLGNLARFQQPTFFTGLFRVRNGFLSRNNKRARACAGAGWVGYSVGCPTMTCLGLGFISGLYEFENSEGRKKLQKGGSHRFDRAP